MSHRHCNSLVWSSTGSGVPADRHFVRSDDLADLAVAHHPGSLALPGNRFSECARPQHSAHRFPTQDLETRQRCNVFPLRPRDKHWFNTKLVHRKWPRTGIPAKNTKTANCAPVCIADTNQSVRSNLSNYLGVPARLFPPLRPRRPQNWLAVPDTFF